MASQRKLSPNPIKLKGIYVLDEDYEKGGQDLLFSNIDFLNMLRGKHLIEWVEWSDEATMSYYVDYFRFYSHHYGVRECIRQLEPFFEVANVVLNGLNRMKAFDHASLFDDIVSVAKARGENNMQPWQWYQQDDETFDEYLDEVHTKFENLEERTPLLDISVDWLKSHPDLHVVSRTQRDKQLMEFAAMVPDMDFRVKEKLDAEPRENKIARALFKAAGLEYVDLGRYQDIDVDGKEVLCRHIKTPQDEHKSSNEGSYLFYESNSTMAYLQPVGGSEIIVELNTGDIE